MESDLRICKVCKEVKRRTLDGKYPNQKDKRYVDDNGKQWNGNTCGDCHKAKMASSMRNKRAK